MNFYIIGGVIAAAFFSGWVVNGWRCDARISKIHEDNAVAVASAAAVASAETKRLQEIKDAALNKATKRAQINAAAADAARTERDGLQQQLTQATTALSSSTCSAARQYGTTVSVLFEQCTGRLESMAREADGHATDSKLLYDSWGIIDATK